MSSAFRYPLIVLVLAIVAPVPLLIRAVESSSRQADSELFYVAGTVGIDPRTGELAEGVNAQVRQAMENIRAVLRAEGMDFSRVVSANVFLSDTRHFAEMNAVYRSYFPVDPPTRATVAADLPTPGAKVQIAMVAARPGVTRRVVKPTALKSPELPYSWGVMAGNTLFVAGATSRDPDTYQPVTGDVGTQTRRVFGNIGAILDAAGLDFGDLTTCTVFMDDAREFGAMNAAYREFVGPDPPARATVRAGLMNPVFKVEIQCTASGEANRAVIVPDGASRPRSPYSPAIRVGSRVYTAGMVGSGPEGVARGDVEAQMRQTMLNLRAALTSTQLGFGDVNAIHIWVPHIAHATTVHSVIDDLVGDGPARTLIGADLMGPDFLVEVMLFAQAAGR